MKYTYTKAYSQYGASMGRRDNITESACAIKFHLQRVPLDSGGYDPGGAYWGLGEPLHLLKGNSDKRSAFAIAVYHADKRRFAAQTE